MVVVAKISKSPRRQSRDQQKARRIPEKARRRVHREEWRRRGGTFEKSGSNVVSLFQEKLSRRKQSKYEGNFRSKKKERRFFCRWSVAVGAIQGHGNPAAFARLALCRQTTG